MSSENGSAAGDTPAPDENPFAQGASHSDGFERVAPQGTAPSFFQLRAHADLQGPRAPLDNPYASPITSGDGFGPHPKPIQPEHHYATTSAEVEALLQPFFHHTNLPAGAEQANGSLRLTREWAIRMLGANQFRLADNGQQVLKLGSGLRARGAGGLRLPVRIIDWLENSNGEDEFMVPAAVVRQYWTRPKYTDG
ncbi:hypothetical protein P171DRAFT_475436 [Karstenula rhodostoma CBS 690.94]|uniref:Uncharacterized protein n=1 Tax=Karstenula rhodostoma CBS 690.94 TaxID=1392251 RepID=A0A9P4PBE8_9PLEO|nr:hypothetical protein P171DRAFT_475436 [Karstenula rhodostoma CBS 690.94]